jgi:DNA-binding NarL/FixJ family response regulator
VNRIRIALMDLQPRLRDIIADALEDEPDLEIAHGELRSDADLRRIDADVVIAGTSEPADLELPSRLLSIAPRIRVLMVAVSGRTAAMYELRPRTTALGEVTPKGLIAAIRQSAQGR